MINQPAIYNMIPHYRGDMLSSFSMQLKFKSGNPIDLTNAKVVCQLRSIAGSVSIFEFNSDGTGDALISILDAENGIFEFHKIKHWDIPYAEYSYDIQVTNSVGETRTYLKGRWTVNQDITRL